MAWNRPRRRFQPEDDPFEMPLGNKDLDDGMLPIDDFDEDMGFDGPMPELALGGKLPPVEGDPFGENWAQLPSDVASSFGQSKQVNEGPAPRAQRERGKKHFWYGMSREEIKEAKASGRGKKKAPAAGQGEKSSFMRALEKREKARGRPVHAGDRARGRKETREAKSGQPKPGATGGKKPPQAPQGNIGLKRRILR